MKIGDKIITKEYGNPMIIDAESPTHYFCKVGKKKVIQVPKEAALPYSLEKVKQEQYSVQTVVRENKELRCSDENEEWNIGDYCKTDYSGMDSVFKVIEILPPFPHYKFKNLRIVNRHGLKFTMPSNYMYKYYFKNG